MIKTNESLQLIDYQNLKIMLEEGKYATFVLILKDESTFLLSKLQAFRKLFENIYDDVLTEWTGELSVFQPTKVLVEGVFEMEIRS